MKPWLRDRRLVAGAVLVVAALVGAFAFRDGGAPPRKVLAASRDVPAGAVLETGDLAEVVVQADGAAADHLLAAESRPDVGGRRATRSLAAGQLLGPADLADEGPAVSLVSVPVAADRVPAGRVAAADRIDVLATYGEGGSRRTVVVARDVEVVSVTTQQSLLGGGDRGVIAAVTVASDARTAALLVFASRAADIDVVRSVGGAGDAAVSVGFPDLDEAGR